MCRINVQAAVFECTSIASNSTGKKATREMWRLIHLTRNTEALSAAKPGKAKPISAKPISEK